MKMLNVGLRQCHNRSLFLATVGGDESQGMSHNAGKVSRRLGSARNFHPGTCRDASELRFVAKRIRKT